MAGRVRYTAPAETLFCRSWHQIDLTGIEIGVAGCKVGWQFLASHGESVLYASISVLTYQSKVGYQESRFVGGLSVFPCPPRNRKLLVQSTLLFPLTHIAALADGTLCLLLLTMTFESAELKSKRQP